MWSSEAPPSVTAAKKYIADLEEQIRQADEQIHQAEEQKRQARENIPEWRRYIEFMEAFPAFSGASNQNGVTANDPVAEQVDEQEQAPILPTVVPAEQPRRPSNPSASATAEVAFQVLLQHGGPLELEDMVPLARAFPNWPSNGDDKRDRGRLYAAMHRADNVFIYTENGWDLIERGRTNS